MPDTVRMHGGTIKPQVIHALGERLAQQSHRTHRGIGGPPALVRESFRARHVAAAPAVARVPGKSASGYTVISKKRAKALLLSEGYPEHLLAGGKIPKTARDALKARGYVVATAHRKAKKPAKAKKVAKVRKVAKRARKKATTAKKQAAKAKKVAKTAVKRAAKAKAKAKKVAKKATTAKKRATAAKRRVKKVAKAAPPVAGGKVVSHAEAVRALKAAGQKVGKRITPIQRKALAAQGITIAPKRAKRGGKAPKRGAAKRPGARKRAKRGAKRAKRSKK